MQQYSIIETGSIIIFDQNKHTYWSGSLLPFLECSLPSRNTPGNKIVSLEYGFSIAHFIKWGISTFQFCPEKSTTGYSKWFRLRVRPLDCLPIWYYLSKSCSISENSRATRYHISFHNSSYTFLRFQSILKTKSNHYPVPPRDSALLGSFQLEERERSMRLSWVKRRSRHPRHCRGTARPEITRFLLRYCISIFEST